MAPTRLAAVALGATALASVVVSDLLAASAVLAIAGLTALDAWSTRNLHNAERTVGDVLSRGVPTEVIVEAVSDGDRIRYRQPGTPDLRVEVDEQPGRLEGTVTATRRGHHQLPPVVSRVRGRLGLGMSTRSIGDPHPVQVFPDMVAAQRIASLVRYDLFRIDGLRVQGSLGLGTSFDSIRDYVDGDDVRRVNWMATARSSAPMVNQYRIEQDRDVLCVIDCGRLMASPIGGASRLDIAVDVVAAMAAVADVVGDRIGVVAFDDGVLRDLPPLRRGGEAAAHAVFDLEPSTHESNYQLVFEKIGGMKRAFVLVLTDVLDDAAARPLARAVPSLARKHEVVVASATDPDVTAALTAAPGSKADAAKALVALDVLTARDRAFSLIRRHGATAIEARPGRLTEVCVAAYLSAKARVRV